MADESSSNLSIESPLSPAILRGLGDRSYDKRKIAALEVTSLVKNLQESGDTEKIKQVLTLLSTEFAKSRNVHHRKGGLIGLAASAIGLASDINNFLEYLIPPVIICFDDPESRVCYYACESLYNISKVARNNILQFFPEIFDGLCILFSHVDVDVKNGANLLDRLIKDIVTEAETFNIEKFIPLLQKYIKRTKPYIRQLLVSWITVLDSVPDINMLDYLPEFLDGLFNMLSDGNREIKQSAENALIEFLREIREAEVVEFGPMVNILIGQCGSKEKSNKLTAVIWLTEFINLGATRLIQHYASILGSVMHCISDPEPEIRHAAKIANQGLLNLVKTTSEPFDLTPLLNALTIELLSEHVSTRVAALLWINMLHEKDSAEMNKSIGDLLPALLKAISDSADEVVLINLQVLARIALDPVQFQRVLNALVHLFLEDRGLLETRGALVIRKLCALLDCREIYISLATILNDKSDLEFVSIMVQTLNLILLTAPELSPLRLSLKAVGDRSGSHPPSQSDLEVFVSLFRCWSHNPVATFSLCLLAQAYDLSACLIHKFAEVDVSVGFLMQIDKLVQLLESPIFIHLRLQLLEVNTRYQADLLKSLYGLLMLLPQSQAYKTLSDRLSTVGALHLHIGLGGIGASSSSSTSSKVACDSQKTSNEIINFENLLSRFESVQEKHSIFRLGLLQQRSLLSQVSPSTGSSVGAESEPKSL